MRTTTLTILVFVAAAAFLFTESVEAVPAAYAGGGNVWFCRKNIAQVMKGVCKNRDTYEITIFLRYIRLRHKYGKGHRFGRSTDNTQKIGKNRRLSTSHKKKRRTNKRRRANRRSLSTDCCNQPCSVEYVQNIYCPNVRADATEA